MYAIIIALALSTTAQAQQSRGSVASMATLRLGPALSIANLPSIGIGGAIGGRVEIYHAAIYADLIGSLGLAGASGLTVGGQIGTHYLWNGNTSRREHRDTTPYFGGGLGYGIKIFADPNSAIDNTWTGGGFDVHVSGGFEMLRLQQSTRAFFQADLAFPTYLLTDTIGSAPVYAPTLMITAGIGYRP